MNNRKCVDRRNDIVFNRLMDALETAIKFCGSQASLAEKINSISREMRVRQSHISMWKTRGRVPADYCPAIERATAGKVRCEWLRPDIDWDVLRGKSL